MPEHLVGDGARLVLQLLHHRVDGNLVLRLGVEIVHAGDEMACTDVVEVVVQNIVATDVAFRVDHRIGIFLTVLADGLATIGQIGVEHTLEFDTHDVAPFRLGGEVEQETLRHALHLAIGKPFAVVLIRGFEQRQTAVDKEIVESDVAGFARLEVAVFHPVEMTVLDSDIVDVGIFLKSDDLYAVFRLFAGDVLHVDVAYGREIATTANLLGLIVEVDFQDGLFADTHFDVAHIDVLDDTTPTGVGLDTEYAFQFGRVHHAVVGKDILTAARDFRTYNHTTVAVFHLTTADDDILRWHVALAPVTVAPTLDGDTVVAGIEETVFDEHTVTAFRIAAVAVRTVVDHLHTAHCDIGRVEGMDDPERGAQQGDVFKENTLTLVETDKLRTQTVFGSEDPLRRTLSLLVIHRYAILTILQQAWARLDALADHAFLPTETGIAVPRPPGVVGTTAVDSALAGDGYILGLEGIDTGRQVEAFQTFPRCLDDGVELGLEGKFEYSAFFYVEVYAILQGDGASKECLTCRDDHTPTAFLRAEVNGLLNGFLVLGCGVGRFGPVLGDYIRLVGKLRYTDALLNLPVSGHVPLGGANSQHRH